MIKLTQAVLYKQLTWLKSGPFSFGLGICQIHAYTLVLFGLATGHHNYPRTLPNGAPCGPRPNIFNGPAGAAGSLTSDRYQFDDSENIDNIYDI